MTEYNIVKAINNSVNNEFLGQERFYVCYADGPQVGLRKSIVGYETEAKAKRCIRDLKRKEIAESILNPRNLVTPKVEQAFQHDMEAGGPSETQLEADAIGEDVVAAYVRQVGCYPYLKKSQYRR